MFGVILRNLKIKRRLYLKQFSWRSQMRHTQTHTHTDTHDNSIRRNEMRCISPKIPYIKIKAKFLLGPIISA